MTDEELENSSFLSAIENIWKNSLGVVSDIFQLFKLEVKLAGRSLAIILMLIVIASLLLLSSWFSLLGAFATWLTTLHFTLIQSLLIVAAINLTVAILVAFYIARISSNLQFNETRKQLSIRSQHETTTSTN
jgi:hypothetical protein